VKNTASVSRITAKNFKNVRLEDGIEFGALTIFVGTNGSGKSNVISLLQFLQESLAGAGIEDLRGQTSFEDAVFRLGGSRILDGTVNAPASVSVEYQFASEGNETLLGIDLLVQGAHWRVVVEREFLDKGPGRSNPPAYYRVHGGKGSGSGSGVIFVFDSPLEVAKQMANPSTHLETVKDIPANELALSSMPRVLENTRFSPETVLLYKPRGMILDATKSWAFFNANCMNLDLVRQAEPKLGQPDYFVSPTGENLALALFNLIQGDYDFEVSLSQVMKDILPLTKRVRAVTSGRFSVTVEWHVEGYDVPFYLHEVSDGTVRMLCWAVVLLSPKPPTLIVIEEPELSIHPAWMPILADWIKRASQNTQVIVTTHSPDILDHFTDQLDDGFIYAFQEDSESPNHFTPKRLDRAKVSGWLEDGWQLGDLYRVGNPAVGGWPW